MLIYYINFYVYLCGLLLWIFFNFLFFCFSFVTVMFICIKNKNINVLRYFLFVIPVFQYFKNIFYIPKIFELLFILFIINVIKIINIISFDLNNILLLELRLRDNTSKECLLWWYSRTLLIWIPLIYLDKLSIRKNSAQMMNL